MNINDYLDKFSSINLDKRARIALMFLYALIMFISIQSQMNTITFILLFAIVPLGIYIYVKKIFPEKKE